MKIMLRERTVETVKTYFNKAQAPVIKMTLPQKAKAVEEALQDFEKTQLPGATSFGQTIYVDDVYVGDVWCYCINSDEEPNCMISYCIFLPELWSRGVATKAVEYFLKTIHEMFGIRSVGAFTYADHVASVRVLQKNGFSIAEEFMEGGVKSVYLQKNF